MVIAVALLHSLALLAQLGGGALLVCEAIRTRKNIAEFQEAIVEAETMREEQRERISANRRKAIKARNAPSPAGAPVFDLLSDRHPARKFVDAAIKATSPESVEPLVQDHGPAAGHERRALMSFLDSQFPATPRKSQGPWPGVVLLFFGIAVSYLANLLSTLAL